MASIFSIYGSIFMDNKDAINAIEDTTKKAKTFGQRMDDLGKKSQKLGSSMTKSLTLPILGVGTAAFKVGSDFQTSMDRIVGLVGVARDEVKAWEKDIYNISRTSGKNIKELGDAMFFITSAGLRGSQAIEVLEMSAKAAAAGLGDTKVVADLVTSAMNAYGIENLSAAKATDILVGAVREGKAEAPALAASMGQVLPIASQMGVSFDQVGAAIAGMTRTGTDASTASTQLRQILMSLIKPTAAAEKQLNALGLSSAELRTQIREEGLMSVLVDLTEAFGDNEEAVANVFGNARSLAGVLDLVGANAEDNIGIFKSLENSTGALGKAFEETDNQGRGWAQLLAEGQILLKELGDVVAEFIIPVFQSLAEWLRGLTEWFMNLSEGQKQTIIQILAIVAAVGPMLLIFAKLITAVKTIGTVFALLGAPLLLKIAIIGAVVYAVTTLIKHFDTLKLVATAMAKTVANVFRTMGNTVIGVLNGMIRGFLTPFNVIIKGLNKLPKVNIPELKFAIPKIPSFKTGLDFVPEDDFLANLHKGERVLTAEENKRYNEGKAGGVNNYFNIEKIEVRDDTDIERIAEELFYLQQRQVA